MTAQTGGTNNTFQFQMLSFIPDQVVTGPSFSSGSGPFGLDVGLGQYLGDDRTFSSLPGIDMGSSRANVLGTVAFSPSGAPDVSLAPTKGAISTEIAPISRQTTDTLNVTSSMTRGGDSYYYNLKYSERNELIPGSPHLSVDLTMRFSIAGEYKGSMLNVSGYPAHEFRVFQNGKLIDGANISPLSTSPLSIFRSQTVVTGNWMAP